MFCFVISKQDYEFAINGELKEYKEPNCVCIGSINSIDEAQVLANILPCLTEVHMVGNINKCCYIACNV